jgi:hypothetical protein
VLRACERKVEQSGDVVELVLFDRDDWRRDAECDAHLCEFAP